MQLSNAMWQQDFQVPERQFLFQLFPPFILSNMHALEALPGGLTGPGLPAAAPRPVTSQATVGGQVIGICICGTPGLMGASALDVFTDAVLEQFATHCVRRAKFARRGNTTTTGNNNKETKKERNREKQKKRKRERKRNTHTQKHTHKH